MAFQVGTKVDPRLLDYSGYTRGMTNAALIQQKAMSDLGSTVGNAILEFSEKREEKKLKKERDLQIDQFLPGLMNTVLGEDVKSTSPEEYKAFSSYIKKNYGDDLLGGLKSIQDLMPKAPDLSAKELEAQELRANTDLPNAVISDIVNDRLLPTTDARGNPTNVFRSASSGQLIDLANPNQPTMVTSDISVETGSETIADAVETPALQFSFPEYVDPSMQNQGLYGQLQVLIERGDSPTGIISSMKQSIDDTLSAQNIDSPIKQDPDVRSYKDSFGANLNIIANALRTNPRYYASEQGDLVEKLEQTSTGFKIGAFTSPKVIESNLKALDSRLKREKRRLTNLLASTQIDRKTASNTKLMLDQVNQAIGLIGLDRYKGKKVESINVNEKRNFFQNIQVD